MAEVDVSAPPPPPSEPIDVEAETQQQPPPQTESSEDAIAPAASTSADADGDVNMASTTAQDDVQGQEGANGDEKVEQDADGVQAEIPKEEVVEEVGEKIPDDACETLYLQNLNEHVRIPVLKETLASLFKPYRPVLPVIAHRNVRMRGQAFVSFPDVESANEARKDVAEFPLYGKAIQISFARGRSDSVVKKLDGDEQLEEHKKRRLEEKKIKRRNNPLRQKAQAKLKAGKLSETGAAPSKKQRLQMPDEYLPPNSVLFIQNLPEGTTSEDLREVFEVHPGLVEIRTIPAKKDIAFVEFADEGAATVAKDALHNFKIDGETKMKVTYARK
ncbi:RNA binding protein [Kwoniella heveanensis CBS 569]|uniref:RNA binding protein n=1 Tax=Kwoniella heveanensis BCC8398 TaxID=1296120 RepID=A0A1B9H215_9TREE|nr:RNA binding protein [Kwoniella heveanensis BCC8398]OCF39715.1 RNA binding protein [Kwoniella heveanensis CBS 569]